MFFREKRVNCSQRSSGDRSTGRLYRSIVPRDMSTFDINENVLFLQPMSFSKNVELEINIGPEK